jgi:hypothetical protein
MLKKLRDVKTAFGSMVILEFWSFWRKTNQTTSKKVKDIVLEDGWWERVDLTIKIMGPINPYNMSATLWQLKKDANNDHNNSSSHFRLALL